MRFTVAWARTLTENNLLRIGIGATSLIAFILLVSTVSLSLKEPFIVERECLSRALTTVSDKKSPAEIESFLRLSLPKRFDTNSIEPQLFLGDSEWAKRQKEQDELTKKGIEQRIYPGSFQIGAKEITVDCDRVLAVGGIRSNMPLQLLIEVRTVTRTPGNPYGLILHKASEVKAQGDKK